MTLTKLKQSIVPAAITGIGALLGVKVATLAINHFDPAPKPTLLFAANLLGSIVGTAVGMAFL